MQVNSLKNLKAGDKIAVDGYEIEFIVKEIKVGPADLIRCKPNNKSSTAEYEFPFYKVQRILQSS